MEIIEKAARALSAHLTVSDECWPEYVDDVKPVLNAVVEECANIALAIDSGRGNEKEIAAAIRRMAIQ